MNPSVDELSEALQEIDSLSYQLQTGNCGKFAVALKNLFGGTIIGVFREPGGYYDHVLLEWKEWWWDGDGLKDPSAYVVPALQKEVANLEGGEKEYIEVSNNERALDRTNPTEVEIGFLEFLVADKLGNVSRLKSHGDFEVRRISHDSGLYRYQFLDSDKEEEFFVVAEDREHAVEKLGV